jgi:membrane-bound serine protease (ClpP class)
LAFIGGVRLTQSKFFDRIALVSTQQRSEGYTSRFIKESMIGIKGTTITLLRPSGKILINGKNFDAYTRGEYIGKDKKVEIIDESGTSFKVREITDNE